MNQATVHYCIASCVLVHL